MESIIRKREATDALELAHAIAVVWNTTYKGIVDDEFLEGLLKNEEQSKEKLISNIDKQLHYYVLTLQEKIIGWIYFTLDSDKYKNATEIHSLYVLKDWQGSGYGKLLYDYAVDIILKNGLKKLVIGCLDGNPANEFYKHLGGKSLGQNLFRDKYLENIYLFEL